MAGRSSLPQCPLCTEGLGTYGGPTTLPCGHNGCLHCMVYLQQRSAQCPLCRADFPPDLALALNYDLKEMLRLAQALTAVEGEDGWQEVTSAARRGEPPACKGGGSAASAPPLRTGVVDVLEGVSSAMDLDPQPWEPDSSSAACRAPGCRKPFSFLLRPRHHCRACGLLFCGACCSERMLLPPKFQQAEPQRVCMACRELLLPIQPLLAGSIAPAVRLPVHDVTDWSAPRALLNPPLSSSMETEIYKATNILRTYTKTVGSLPPERTIPPAILRGAAGLAVLSVARVGAGWSLSVGSGLVVARTGEGGWSAPSALLSLASSVGWQLGLEVQDLVLVLRSESALKAFCSSQLGVGGALSIAAGPVGRAAAARALAAVGGAAMVYSYSATRGLFAGLSLEGTVLSTRDAVNQAFYGRKVSARQLLLSGAVPAPPAAAALYAALDSLLDHAGEVTGPQFLSAAYRAGSEPGLHPHAVHDPPPAVSAPPPPATAEDEWEPEEASPQRGSGPAGVAGGRWRFEDEEGPPAAWGHLFD
ncbi:senescence-associated -like [Chlorella sorokiniana]|uniref:Senescence-associated-like n=1 Tax=Chlorella sorokiniana TaxID=3076 RepID=A0A2P6TTP0_CHLSO|nr:senescence-associated -like [Chlorella sorokiniana]|eukprot:PRW57440.1 senescence-associated -like [Chlorella sorokiniana]